MKMMYQGDSRLGLHRRLRRIEEETVIPSINQIKTHLTLQGVFQASRYVQPKILSDNRIFSLDLFTLVVERLSAGVVV